MYYHLDIEKQIKIIFKKNALTEFNHHNESKDLIDLRDGELYKNILELEDGHLFKNNKAFTFLINTDGISFCTKSKLAIWPVFLVINELPLAIRYSIDNVILAGKLRVYFDLYCKLSQLI
jgi:hypothetical protein